jgi:hypothetical protein
MDSHDRADALSGDSTPTLRWSDAVPDAHACAHDDLALIREPRLIRAEAAARGEQPAARGRQHDLVRSVPGVGHRLIRAALVVEDSPRIGRANPSLEHPPVGRGERASW